mmetsp:Transcript_26598/g.75102  ORF Transcript_26598/g.75102 Transcript_26598/m.75102 type:complete len:150 (+) Transcript_26598:67-516(+)
MARAGAVGAALALLITQVSGLKVAPAGSSPLCGAGSIPYATVKKPVCRVYCVRTECETQVEGFEFSWLGPLEKGGCVGKGYTDVVDYTRADYALRVTFKAMEVLGQCAPKALIPYAMPASAARPQVLREHTQAPKKRKLWPPEFPPSMA